MEKFVKLGTYVTSEGLKYDCEFIPEEKVAVAIGPLPIRSINTGVSKTKFEVIAHSEDEARENLQKEIGDGYFK